MSFDGADVGVGTEEDVFELGFLLVHLFYCFFVVGGGFWGDVG